MALLDEVWRVAATFRGWVVPSSGCGTDGDCNTAFDLGCCYRVGCHAWMMLSNRCLLRS